MPNVDTPSNNIEAKWNPKNSKLKAFIGIFHFFSSRAALASAIKIYATSGAFKIESILLNIPQEERKKKKSSFEFSRCRRMISQLFFLPFSLSLCNK
jgi:hypothetical protein